MTKPRPPRTDGDPGPIVSFREEPAGRETLAAISRERNTREVRSTKHYGDRISNAPGAVSPRIARALDSHPEIAVSVRPAGRATVAAIERELDADGPTIEVSDPKAPGRASILDWTVERMCTFQVRVPVTELESPLVQAELVKERLLAYLPVDNARDVTRVEVRAGTDATTTQVCVWCRIP